MHLKSKPCSLPVSPMSKKHFILAEQLPEGEPTRGKVMPHFDS